MLRKLSLCYSIVYHYKGAQRYDQFLQVGGLAWFSSLIIRTPQHLLFAVYIVNLLTSCSLPFSELSLVGLALDLVDYSLSCSAMTLLVGSYNP